MPRPKAMLPKYEFHVSGQARVRFCGKDYYLGKFGTPESYAKYHALVGEYLQNGKQPPAVPNSSGGDKEHLGEQPIRIRDVTADFRYRVLPRYDSDQGQYNRFSNLCDLLDKRHGSESPDAFGPRKLEEIRDLFIRDGNCRSYVNQKVRLIVRIFRHGVSR